MLDARATKGTVLLSAGGTGGHLFPAEALAHEMTGRGWTVHLVTDNRANRFSGSFPAAAVHQVSASTFGSRNPLALSRAVWTIWRGFRESTILINRLKPKIVIGFGGYPTLPPLYAATRRGVPTLIHEQNAVMGRANKGLAPRVTAIAGGFLPEGGGPHAAKVFATGNPVRPAVLEAAARPFNAPSAAEPFRLLVFGGSQGAQFFSQAIPAAVSLLPAPLRERLRIVQQARAEDEAEVRARYAELGLAVEVSPFFTDMAQRIADAHLVISRSGASTVSEVAVIGRPAMFVPYPYALDHDQAANAAALAASGGAEVHPQATLTPQRIADLLASRMEDAEGLAKMAAAARLAGKPNAAGLLADLAEAIAAGQTVEHIKQGGRP
ncbi:undecaprenyldiphospho-muramoylpentapeptide beta-N-acetylglucosaminyltransferase [Tianweitania sediminis]|uniref:UDP-N-acetylglucosamine--N-acetylmuramyl-(pentapeptide) pyrophosphoryl-undecaprenol N-acetylglucosamine transferase n=1 Tax=Tianweitania sediminis TaxID=1502156 RepID=A0A8J7UJU5_9HYPH|nr:undecaprenyldiphospho-muramoylpentapeptide beta-N-acetylglucosaminyltransferase [Tianweitania sediminis]MBP0439200.1 undecaprenyldiphospho-muramoylpentapeptide beta-N-acetylglucosaminyltransferase [Tianweitania sediminis]